MVDSAGETLVLPSAVTAPTSGAMETDVAFVDVFAAFHGDATTLIGPDGLHPTADGYRVMAGAFFDSIKAALEIPVTSIAPTSLRTPSVSVPSRKK